MNSPPFVAEALERLRHWFDEVEGGRTTTGFTVRVAGDRLGRRTYAAEVRTSLTRVSAATLPVGDGLPTLVIAPHLGDPVADVLRDRGIEHLDAAGNAWLAWGSTLIDVRGRRRPKEPAPRTEDRAARAFSRTGVQVLFVLLAWPELAAGPLRSIATAAGVSLGSAKIVMDELSAGRYLYPVAGARRLAYGRDLLNRWAEAYSLTLWPRLTLGRYSGGDGTWWLSPAVAAGGVQLGGETASAVIDPYLRPETVTLYADEQPFRLLAQHGLRRDDDGPVAVRRRFWTDPGGGRDAVLVPVPLIYADLLATGESRQREQAERLRGNDARLQRIDEL